MTAGQWVILLVVVVILVALGLMLSRRRRTGQLREQFGPEYDRLIQDRDGDRRDVEAELADRAKRRDRLDVKELSSTERDRYAEQWRHSQLRFLDEPETAIVEADRLVMTVMRARGYPVEDFEQQAADLSVDHPVVVQNYRAGHEIAERHATGQASTEDLRQGMIHYRALVEELLGIETADADATARPRGEPSVAAAGTTVADRDMDGRADRDATDVDAAERDAATRDAATRDAAEREAAADRAAAENTAVADRDQDVDDRAAAERAVAEREAEADQPAPERLAADREAAARRLPDDRGAETRRTEVR